MADVKENSVRVTVFLSGKAVDVVMELNATIAQLRSVWHQKIGAAHSVSFFTFDGCYLPDKWSLECVRLEVGSVRVLELEAVLRSTFHLRLFGFDNTATVFEAAPSLTPDELREEMAETLGLLSSDFNLFVDNKEVDQSAPFSEIQEGSQLVLDPVILVQITDKDKVATTIHCNASTTVGELRRLQEMPDAIALFAEQSPRVLQDSTNIAHIMVSTTELAAPIHLIAEEKQFMLFQPGTLDNLQQDPTPVDLTDLLGTRRQIVDINLDGGSSYNTMTVSASIPHHRATVDVKSSYKTRNVSASTPCHLLDTGSSSETKTDLTCHLQSYAANLPVRIRLPDGLQLLHFVRPHDTVADLLTVLQSLGLDLAVSDVSWGDRWLTSAADWQHQSLTSAWRLEVGAELLLHERPSFLRLSAWSPHGNAEGRLVHLNDEQSAGEVLETAKNFFKEAKITERTVICGHELLYEAGGLQRRSIRCYVPKGNEYPFIDLESGTLAELNHRSILVRRYLSATSALPASPLHIPYLIVETEMKVLKVNADRQLKATDPGAMQDTRFVAFMPGLWCGEQPEKYFWKMRGGGFVDSLSGDLFPSEQWIPDNGQRSWVNCLLRRGDQPPLCRVPKGELLLVFRRVGIEVIVEDGRLRATEVDGPCDIERWVVPLVHKFDLDFTASTQRQ